MRRIIFIGCCALFALSTYAQKDKVMRIHKTDGTVVEYPIYSIRDFHFNGKAIVKDDDYTQIKNLAVNLKGTRINIDITATFNIDDPYAGGNNYQEDWGILYSTSPNITIENGKLIDLSTYQHKDSIYSSESGHTFMFGESVRIVNEYDSQDEGCYASLEYNTTYYFRSYVRRSANNDIYEEEYFYSEEKSINTGNPPMIYYGVNSNPEDISKTGYVFPSDEAWNAFDEQYPYFSLSNRDNKDTIIKHWNNYLTPERTKILKSQCTTIYECLEGTLYIADNINEDFCHYLLNIYDVEYQLSGYSEDLDASSNTTGIYVDCDTSWNLPTDGYWKYTADDLKNPKIKIPLPKCLLANYDYKIEIVLAPNTEAEETLPSKITSRIQYKVGGGLSISNKTETSISECTIIAVDPLSIETFTEAYLEIYSDMNTGTSNRNPDKNKFLPILRIAQVNVTPISK